MKRDDSFSARFRLDGPGWTGGDGAQSIAIGNRNLWVFGDSFLGEVQPDGSRPGARMIRSSALLETARGLKLAHPARSFITTGEENDSWYWTGDGVYEEGEVRIPVYRVRSKPGEPGWNFEIYGVSVARLSWPGLRLLALEDRPYNGVMWGLSVYPARRWTYIYGWGDTDKLYIARARAGALDGAWRYRTGEDTWSRDAADAAPVLTGVTTASVAPYRDRFVLISHRPRLSEQIAMYVAKTPYGPFVAGRTIYRTPETGPGAFTYVATAHPQIRGDGLLIGYSVNGWEASSALNDASVYRPRFIRADLGCLLPGR